MSTVWIVKGSAGDYEDHREWSIAAYADEASATCHVALAKAEESRLHEWAADDANDDLRYDDTRCPRNAYDPEHHEWYNLGHVHYFAEEVPLRKAAPKVKVADLRALSPGVPASPTKEGE